MKTKRLQIAFTIEVEGDESNEGVEEAITTLIDEELAEHREGAARCGVRFLDACEFEVRSE